MRLHLDACAITCSFEGLPAVRDAAVRLVEQAEAAPQGAVITSRLSRLRCRVKPLRDGAVDLLARYDAFFSRAGLVLPELSAGVVERATELRAHTVSRPLTRFTWQRPSSARRTSF